MTPRHLLEPARLAGSALLRAQSDARLVDLTRAGNDRAFEAIVTRHKGELLRYCSRILPDGRSEDAVQQVFVNAYRALHRDTTPLSLRSWLFSIAHNVSLNVLRQRGGDHEPLEAHPGTEEPAHVTHERRERLREVLAAVAALPPGQRDAIVLRELEGRGHEEIARELGVTGGAARQLISRARDGVRRAAAAVVPIPLLTRLTDETAPSPTVERVAELTAVGGGITVGKVVATGAIGATLLGGAITGPGLVEGDRHRSLEVAEAAPTDPADRVDEDESASAPAAREQARGREGSSDGPNDRDEDRSGSNSGPGGGEREEEDDEPDDDDDNSGPGDGDDDEPDEDDNSGPGDGDDHDEPDEYDNSGDDHDEPDEDDNSGDDHDEPDEDDNSGDGSGDESDEPDDDDNSGSGSSDDDESDSSGSGSGEPDSDEDEILEPDDDDSEPGSDRH